MQGPILVSGDHVKNGNPHSQIVCAVHGTFFLRKIGRPVLAAALLGHFPQVFGQHFISNAYRVRSQYFFDVLQTCDSQSSFFCRHLSSSLHWSSVAFVADDLLSHLPQVAGQHPCICFS